MAAVVVESNPRDFTDFPALLALITHAFAGMEGRIDPPSSILALDVDDLRAKAQAEDFFVIRQGGRPIACLFGLPRGAEYYVGKLAVAQDHRRAGLARALIDAAGARARSLGLGALCLQSRVELVENHATFARLGFVQTGTSTHPGFARPTSIWFRRDL